MPKNRKNKAGTWRDLKDGSPKSRRGSPMTWRAKMRVAWVWTKRTFLAALLAGTCAGVWLLWERIDMENFASESSPQIGRIELKTDGAINGAWLNGFLKIPRNTKLAEVNIFSVKMALEKIEQIKTANVERIYPDVLRITLSEHKPMMKMRVGVDGEDRIYAMSPDGIFFTPVCLPPEFIAKLLWLEGAKSTFAGSRPKEFEHAKEIVQFLGSAQTLLPKALDSWRSIDVSAVESRVLPVVVAKTATGTRIVFRLGDYKKQFDNLEYILRFADEKSLTSIEQIDLTLKGRADVKLSDGISK